VAKLEDLMHGEEDLEVGVFVLPRRRPLSVHMGVGKWCTRLARGREAAERMAGRLGFGRGSASVVHSLLVFRQQASDGDDDDEDSEDEEPDEDDLAFIADDDEDEEEEEDEDEEEEEEGESEDEAPPPVVSQIKKDRGTKKNKGGKDSKQDAKAPKKEGKAKGAKKVKKGDTASVAMESLIAQISAT